jgi:hypothetical protein
MATQPTGYALLDQAVEACIADGSLGSARLFETWFHEARGRIARSLRTTRGSVGSSTKSLKPSKKVKGKSDGKGAQDGKTQGGKNPSSKSQVRLRNFNKLRKHLGLHEYKSWDEVEKIDDRAVSIYEAKVHASLIECGDEDEKFIELIALPKSVARLEEAGSETACKRGDTSKDAVMDKFRRRIQFDQLLESAGISTKESRTIQSVYPRFRISKDKKTVSSSKDDEGPTGEVPETGEESKAKSEARKGKAQASVAGVSRGSEKTFHDIIRIFAPKIVGAGKEEIKKKLHDSFPYSQEGLSRLVRFRETFTESQIKIVRLNVDGDGESKIHRIIALLASGDMEHPLARGIATSDKDILPTVGKNSKSPDLTWLFEGTAFAEERGSL